MGAFQYWLMHTLFSVQFTKSFMNSKWGWPATESVHFLGLSLLVGTIGAFDLRLLGVAKRIPIGALHRLVPWGVLGYIINICTGFLFLTIAPDQYIYNPSFHFKILFMMFAGVNILIFYSAVFRKVRVLGPGADAPLAAKMIGAASLSLWIGVIICGRLLTFYRPIKCDGTPADFLWICFP
jgi:uncharacterized membrane protein